MITLKQWLELVDYRVTEGSEYFYRGEGLYNTSLFCLDSWNGKQDGYSSTVVFAPQQNQKVYLAELHDYKNNQVFAIKDEAITLDQYSWDQVPLNLVTVEEFIEKAKQLFKS